jgi:HD superfamily phosphodiesterase
MIEICERTGASRDLVVAAVLHDIGYAGLKIPGTLEGAKWDSKDVRETHMAAGAEMSKKYLRELQAEGALELTSERIEKLVEIIATHDNPYIGKPLNEQEALLHRDADRAFVISAVSFWKDYLAYLSDAKHTKRFAEALSLTALTQWHALPRLNR